MNSKVLPLEGLHKRTGVCVCIYYVRACVCVHCFFQDNCILYNNFVYLLLYRGEEFRK